MWIKGSTAKILQSGAKPLVCGEINGKIISSVFALYVHILRTPAASFECAISPVFSHFKCLISLKHFAHFHTVSSVLYSIFNSFASPLKIRLKIKVY